MDRREFIRSKLGHMTVKQIGQRVRELVEAAKAIVGEEGEQEKK